MRLNQVSRKSMKKSYNQTLIHLMAQQPYVEIEISDQKFERKDITIGLSDGVKVEVLSGIEMSDKIKIWNKTEPIKIEPEESAFDEFEDR